MNGRFFVCLFVCLFAFFVIFILHVIYFNSDAQSITWNEPPPVTTVSDYNFVHTSKIQLYEGSTNRKLNWRYSLTQELFLVSIELEDASVVAKFSRTATKWECYCKPSLHLYSQRNLGPWTCHPDYLQCYCF